MYVLYRDGRGDDARCSTQSPDLDEQRQPRKGFDPKGYQLYYLYISDVGYRASQRRKRRDRRFRWNRSSRKGSYELRRGGSSIQLIKWTEINAYIPVDHHPAHFPMLVQYDISAASILQRKVASYTCLSRLDRAGCSDMME